MGNLLWQAITTPSQPKTPEQIEAERQAEVLRQQQEAERQAKIQKYLDDEAAKKQKKDAELDKEAQDSLSLLDHKTPVAVTMTDDELLGINKYASSTCTEELEGVSSDLDAFGKEAQKEGLQFAADDALKNTKQSLNLMKKAAKDSAAAKLGVKEYADDYKILKEEMERRKHEADYIIAIKKCLDTKGCSLIALSNKWDEDFKEWVKGLSTQGIHEAADRVDKAASFYRDYTSRLEKRNNEIINGAAKCLAN